VSADVEVDGKLSRGISADGLAPKWFTKDPGTDFETEDLPQMLSVIRHAADTATGMPATRTLFSWWHSLYGEQMRWGEARRLPSLLTSLGVSLIERAVIDAFCRAKNITFFQALKNDLFRIDFGSLRSELRDVHSDQVVNASPLPAVAVRHTIGMSDPLSEADICDSDRIDDGLPQSLAESIRRYGLKYFKIKLSGNLESDVARLRRIHSILQSTVTGRYSFTLDGNENYPSLSEFQNQWRHLLSDPSVESFIAEGLLFVEQPVHRDTALNESAIEELQRWSDRPPLIIDESDGDLSAFPQALRLGYAGTSHKNCKGVIKGVAQLATLQHRASLGQRCILSAEDLGNVGPVALPQDLAVVATLGISHVERNGHHYFAGLRILPEREQHRVQRDLPHLYTSRDTEFPTLAIRKGTVNLHDINQAPFGISSLPDLDSYERWDF